jgi:cell division protein FtsW
MTKKQHHMPSVIYDVQLLFPVLFLVGIGIVMVYSASSTLAIKKFGTGYFFLKKQAFFAFAGVIVLVISRHFPYKYYRMLAYPLLGLSRFSLSQESSCSLSAGIFHTNIIACWPIPCWACP